MLNKMSTESLNELQKELSKEIGKRKKEEEEKYPKHGTNFFYVGYLGGIHKAVFASRYRERFDTGNFFLTKQEAKASNIYLAYHSKWRFWLRGESEPLYMARVPDTVERLTCFGWHTVPKRDMLLYGVTALYRWLK